MGGDPPCAGRVCPGSRVRTSFMRWRGDVPSFTDGLVASAERASENLCFISLLVSFLMQMFFFFLILALLGLSCHMQDLGCRMCDLVP